MSFIFRYSQWSEWTLNVIHCGVNTHLSLLLVEIVDNDADEEIEGEEGAEYDEDDKVKVHVQVDFSDGLLLHLKPNSCIRQLVTVTSS